MTDDQSSDGTPTPKSNEITWEMFLVKYAPNKQMPISNLSEELTHRRRGDNYVRIGKLRTPTIELPCGSEACGGIRFFDCDTEVDHSEQGEWQEEFLKYSCRHCEQTPKIFAVMFRIADDDSGGGSAFKLGEIPAFGPQVPPRVLELIQPNEAFFKQGLRAENQGLGIGAFAYYRRVVENQKDRLFEAIISAAQQTGVAPERIAKLEKAKAAFQFGKSVADFKHLIPDSLLIKGHNPLTLLHSALSGGIHNDSDEECLELARDIRAILTVFAEKHAQAIKSDDEILRAVEHLARSREAKEPRGSAT